MKGNALIQAVYCLQLMLVSPARPYSCGGRVWWQNECLYLFIYLKTLQCTHYVQSTDIIMVLDKINGGLLPQFENVMTQLLIKYCNMIYRVFMKSCPDSLDPSWTLALTESNEPCAD